MKTRKFGDVEAVCLWSEDECTSGLPGHEYLPVAWKRLFSSGYDLAGQFSLLMSGGPICL